MQKRLDPPTRLEDDEMSNKNKKMVRENNFYKKMSYENIKFQTDEQANLEDKNLNPELTKNKIKIGHWYLNGIRATLRHKEARKYFDKCELDFLCLNGTQISRKKFLKSKIPKYSI